MADAVSTRTLYEDSIFVVKQFTNTSDSTGESAVKKVLVRFLI